MVIIWSLIAGLLVVYGLPYFLAGLKGKQHASPFGSGAVHNFLFGWLVVALGLVFLHIAHVPVHPVRGFICFQIGVLLAGLYHANNWTRAPHKK